MQQFQSSEYDEDGFYEDYQGDTEKGRPRKRKRFSRWVKLIAVLTVIAVICVAVFGFGFFRKSEFSPLVDHGFATVCYAPENNATPLKTSAVDDIAHMNYRLQQQDYWSSEMHSTVNTIVSQNVVTYKQYANGILISEDITTSSMINSAKQFCTTEGRVIWRNAAGGKGTYNGINTPFSEGTPEGNLSIADYKVNRGLPPSEFSVYVINENTILNASEVTDNKDGTFSRTYQLNPVHTPEENSAVYYYKQQMYVTGGLDEHPTFSSVTVTYTYDADWRILKSEISESYTAKMIIPADCNSTSVTIYDYTPEKAMNSAYEDYFVHYIDKEITPVEDTITAVKCLTSAFGSVLTDAVTFRLDLAFDEKLVSGTAFLDIDSMDVRVSLGNIKLYLEEIDGKQTLYLSYGTGIKACFDLSALDELAGGGISLDTDMLLEQLGEGEFVVNENKTCATLDSDLNLFGFTIPVRFTFIIGTEGSISLGEVDAELVLNGMTMDATLSFADKNDIAKLTTNDKSQYIDLSGNLATFTSFAELIEAPSLDVDLSYRSEGTEIAGNVVVDLKNLSAKGKLQMCFGENPGSAKELSFGYVDGIAYLALASSGKDPVKFKAGLADTVALIRQLVGDSAQEDFIREISFSDLLFAALTDNDFARLFALKEGLRFEIDGTNLLALLGSNIEVGTISVTLGEGTVSLTCAEAEVVLSAGESFSVDKEYYIAADDVNDLLPLLKTVSEIILDGGVTLSGTIVMDPSVSIAVDELSVSWTNGLQLYLEATLFPGVETGKKIYAAYDGKDIKLIYDGLKVRLASEEIQPFLQSVLSVYKGLSADISALPSLEGAGDLTAIFGGSEFDWLEFLSDLTIGASEKGVIRVDYKGYAFDFAKGEKKDTVLGVNLTAENLTVEADLKKFVGIKSMEAGEYLDAAEAIPLLNEFSAVLENRSVSLVGMLSLEVRNTLISLHVKDCTIDWNNGVSVYLRAGLAVNGVEQEIFFLYDGMAQLIKFAYGGTGAQISIVRGEGSDLEILEKAFVTAYGRILAVVDEMVEENPLPPINSLNELLELIGLGESAVTTVDGLLMAIGVEGKDISSVIQALTFGISQNGNLTVAFGALTVELINETTEEGFFGLGATLRLEDFGLTLDDCHVNPVGGDRSMPDVVYLEAEDFADLLDYLGATAELLIETNLSVDVTGKLFAYGDGDKYASSGYIKYDITASLAYEQGASGFPVHVNAGTVNTETGRREGMNFYIAPDVYLHLNVSLLAKNVADDSLIVDLYLLDADPVTSEGTTVGAYTTDGNLDVYLSISKKSSGGEPLKIYAPLDEIMTFVAMGGAMLELDTLTASNEEVMAVISEVVNIFEQLLFNNYLPYTKDQFASLGSSLIRQFIPGGLQTLLDDLVRALEKQPGNSEVEMIEKEAFIKSLDVSAGSFALVLDSAAVYGDASAHDLTFSATKERVTTTTEDGEEISRSRITAARIDNVYLDENLTDMLNLACNVAYGNVKKIDSLAGYRDFSEIDTLVKALVNSATHEDGTDKNGDATYKLNNNFYVSGTVKMDVPVAEPLVFASVDLMLDGLKISIDEDNKILLDVAFSYSKTSAKILGFPITVIENDATVDLSIRDDMIFMRKTVSGNTTYRIMSLAEFSADIMNQISWLFSFSGTVKSLMNKFGSSGGVEPVDTSGYDYGALLSAYLKNYTYSVNENGINWNLILNGTTIGSLAGITMSDIAVTLGAADKEGVYELSTLSASGNLFGAIDYSADLTYDNIHGKFAEGKSDKTTAIPDTKVADGATWTELLGGTAYDEIKESTYWDLMLRETDKPCLEYTDGGDIRVGWLTYEFSDLQGTTTEIGKGQYVLYNISTGTVYTVLNYPSLDGFVAADFTAVWKNISINGDDGLLVQHAGFEKTYTVTLSGSYMAEGYVWNEDRGVYEMQIAGVYQQLLIAKDTVVEGEDGFYALKGYTDAEGNSYEFNTKYDTAGNECFVIENISSDLSLIAVWEQVYRVAFYDENGMSVTVKYYYADAVLEESNLPTVPEKVGYTGRWTDKNGVSAIGQTVLADHAADYAFYAAYQINSYTVRLTSDAAVTDESFVYDETLGLWCKTSVYQYGLEVSLGILEPQTATRTFNGWRDEAGKPVSTAVIIRGDMVFSAAWTPKTISVTRYSAVAFEGATGEDENGYYQTVVLNGSNDYALQEVTLTVGDAANYQFFGWWYEGESGWQKLDNVTSFVVEDIDRIDVYALFAVRNVNVSKASKSGLFSYTYNFEATVGIKVVGKSDLISKISLVRLYCYVKFDNGMLTSLDMYSSENPEQTTVEVSKKSVKLVYNWSMEVGYELEYNDGNTVCTISTVDSTKTIYSGKIS